MQLKYEHSIERSMEYFRMALPLMTKQATGVHPVSYAVWYEYVSRDNPALRNAVDQQLRDSGQLDEAATASLFRRHIAELDSDMVQKVTTGFTRVMTDVAESTSQAGKQTARYQASLSHLSNELHSQLQGSPAATALQAVVAGTQETQAALAALQERLDESTLEIAALRDEVRRARRESLSDSLTGLANRRAFEQRLTAAIALAEVGAGGAPPCLVMGDIDHFKQINDRFGHSFGDQVLRAVAKVLEAKLPANGLAARIGGEEFALLLPASSMQAAQVVAEKVRSTIASSRIRRAGQTESDAKVTLSQGIASWRPGDDAMDLMERADKALYAAKKAGRDCIVMAPLA